MQYVVSRLIRSLALLVAWMPALSVAGDVSEILEKMEAADQQLNYQGVLVMRKNDSLITMKVEHGADERGIWESMESLSGSARKVVRINDEVTSIYPEQQLITVAQAKDKVTLHPTLPANLQKLEAYYRIKRLSDDRIAGHQAVVLDVMPNDKYRYGYRYWLDTETGVLLKCDLKNEQGKVVEQMMFSSLQYLKEIPKKAFSEVEIEGYEHRQLESGRDDITQNDWLVSNLPSGFMHTQSSTRNSNNSESVHLVYSDGLASVSIFIEPGDDSEHRLDGASPMGALNAYGARVNQHMVTVMGEVPASTVKRIALSVQPATQ